MILLDTSGLLAAIDESQRGHRAAATALTAASPPLLLSPFVLAELEYLLARRVSAAAADALLAEVGRGAFMLAPFGAADVQAARQVIGRHEDMEIGLADASIVVLAERHGTRDVLTLNERHFRVLQAGGEPLPVLPADLA